MRCSAVASLLAYFFSRRQARSRFYRALLAGISNALHSRIAALLRERQAREATPISRLKAASALTQSRREADKSNAIRYQRADQQTDIVWICHREVMQL
jgi:hypothetical protein